MEGSSDEGKTPSSQKRNTSTNPRLLASSSQKEIGNEIEPRFASWGNQKPMGYRKVQAGTQESEVDPDLDVPLSELATRSTASKVVAGGNVAPAQSVARSGPNRRFTQRVNIGRLSHGGLLPPPFKEKPLSEYDNPAYPDDSSDNEDETEIQEQPKPGKSSVEVTSTTKKRGRPPRKVDPKPVGKALIKESEESSEEEVATPAPKRRGRPPKTPVITKAAMKGSEESSEEEGATPAPKKRGRPPKTPVNTKAAKAVSKPKQKETTGKKKVETTKKSMTDSMAYQAHKKM
jgi:AT hook motif